MSKSFDEVCTALCGAGLRFTYATAPGVIKCGCPYHNDTSPSATLDISKGFKCHSCGVTVTVADYLAKALPPQWKSAAPLPVVQMLPIDPQGKVMIMHRSPHVRSVPNVWSCPSGMHDIGETIGECANRELFEEFNLRGEKYVVLGTYENIPGDGYHWVITVVLVWVDSFDEMINKEPEKHDKTEIIHHWSLLDSDFFERYPFHSSFVEWAKEAFRKVIPNLFPVKA